MRSSAPRSAAAPRTWDSALKLQPQYQAVNPVSSRSDFLFVTALEDRLPVIAHTGAGVPFALPSLFIAPARRFPALPIILGHAGGSVYYLETVVAASVCPNIYIKVSSLMPHHILEILSHVDSSRLLAGSDLPESMDVEFSKILGLDIDPQAKRNILWDTPWRIFEPGTVPHGCGSVAAAR